MIEKLVTSKTRIKILKLFLSHIDDRYYLRELERLLDESLSPLRRQLLRLAKDGILITEEEANLKYYRLNKNFEGLEELKRLVLDKEIIDSTAVQPSSEDASTEIETARSASPRQFRFDLVLLSFISIFVLLTAIFVVYTNMKSIKQVASLIAKDTTLPTAAVEQTIEPRQSERSNGEMISKKWKVMPGNIPVLSNGETGEDTKNKEL